MVHCRGRGSLSFLKEAMKDFVDLPATDFPFTVEMFNMDTDEVVHTQVVTGPGALEVPGYKELGVPRGRVGVHITWGNGETSTSTPEDGHGR